MSHEIPHQPGNSNRQPLISDEIGFINYGLSEVKPADGLHTEKIVDLETYIQFKIANEITAARNHMLENQYLFANGRNSNLIGGIAKAVFGRAIPIIRDDPLTERDLRIRESVLGATIFGEFKKGETRREFCFDRRIDDRVSWFFHQVLDGDEVTLHYEVHPQGILRISSNPTTENEFIEGQELNDFLKATKDYHGLVMEQIYNHDQYSSEKAA